MQDLPHLKLVSEVICSKINTANLKSSPRVPNGGTKNLVTDGSKVVEKP